MEPKGGKCRKALSIERPNIPVGPTILVSARRSSIIINSALPHGHQCLALIDNLSGPVTAGLKAGTQLIPHKPSSAASGFDSLSPLFLHPSWLPLLRERGSCSRNMVARFFLMQGWGQPPRKLLVGLQTPQEASATQVGASGGKTKESYGRGVRHLVPDNNYWLFPT